MKSSTLALALIIALGAPLASFAEDGGSTGSSTPPPRPSFENRGEVRTDVKKEREDNASTSPLRHPIEALRAAVKGEKGEMGSSTPGSRPLFSERKEARQETASTTAWKGFGTAEVRPIALKKIASSTAENLKERATQEVERRTQILNAFIERLQGAKRLGDEDKTSLTANLQARLGELETLKQHIADGTSTTTLKTDIDSLKNLHKEFTAELPKAAVSGAGDRILSVAAQLEQFSAKLATRIETAKTAGTDTASLETALSALNASVASAKVNAQVAIDAISALDTTATDANKTAVAGAKAKIVAGQKDLQAARESAKTILKGLGGSKPENPQQ